MGCGGSKSPALLATCDTGVLVRDHVTDKGMKTGAGGAQMLKMDGNLLYLLGNKGLAVWDIEHPNKIDAAAAKITQIDTHCCELEAQTAMLVNGNVLYIAGGKGLGICDISDKRSPKMVGEPITTGVLTWGDAAAMIMKDNILYLFGGKGLQLYDVSNPQAPLKLGELIDTGVIGSTSQAAVMFGTAPNEDTPAPLYVCGGKGFQVFSLENPKVPAKVGDKIDTKALSCDGGASMVLVGSRLFIAGGKGLASLDVTDPMAPKMINTETNTGCLNNQGGAALIAKNDTMYVCGGYGLGVFTITTHTIDKQGKTISTGVCSHTGAVATLLDGEVLYVAGGKGLASFKASELVQKTK